MEKLIQQLINLANSSEKSHREYQKAERYGNAAYYQGRRDAFTIALDAAYALRSADAVESASPALSVSDALEVIRKAMAAQTGGMN